MSEKTLKRFYKTATARPVEGGGGYEIFLDERAAKTPDRTALILPNAQLADAVAAEWQGQEERIRPLAMPLTRLACQAIDRIPPQREAVIHALIGYGETDMLCYRAEEPEELVERQTRCWQPLLDWAQERYGARLMVFAGISPQAQPSESLDAFGVALGGESHFGLSGLHSLAHSCGSLVLALAGYEKRLDADGVWKTAQLEEDFNIEKWGEDSFSLERRENLQKDINAALQYLSFLR